MKEKIRHYIITENRTDIICAITVNKRRYEMDYKEALDVLVNKISIDVEHSEDLERDYQCLEKCKEALEYLSEIGNCEGCNGYECENCMRELRLDMYNDRW